MVPLNSPMVKESETCYKNYLQFLERDQKIRKQESISIYDAIEQHKQAMNCRRKDLCCMFDIEKENFQETLQREN